MCSLRLLYLALQVITLHCEKCSVAKHRSPKNVDIFLQVGKEIGLYANADKTKYM
jgi:hypothetical protein